MWSWFTFWLLLHVLTAMSEDGAGLSDFGSDDDVPLPSPTKLLKTRKVN